MFQDLRKPSQLHHVRTRNTRTAVVRPANPFMEASARLNACIRVNKKPDSAFLCREIHSRKLLCRLPRRQILSTSQPEIKTQSSREFMIKQCEGDIDIVFALMMSLLVLSMAQIHHSPIMPMPTPVAQLFLHFYPSKTFLHLSEVVFKSFHPVLQTHTSTEVYKDWDVAFLP